MIYLRPPEAAATTARPPLPTTALLLIAALAVLAAVPLTILFGAQGDLVAAGGALAGAVFVLAAWRPGVACVILALAVPLTAGLGRGTLIPLLRPGEALIALTLAGLILKRALSHNRRGGLHADRLDWLIVSFVAVAVLVPSIVLIFGDVDADVATWMSVLAPAQFLIVYWIYSRSRLDAHELPVIVNTILLTSVIVGLIGIAQAADLPGVRDFSDAYLPEPAAGIWEEPVYRANATLEHFSALGGFGVFNFLLAFALHVKRVHGFPAPWLGIVMLANAGAIVASQTWASAVALPFSCALVCWYLRKLPPHLGPMVVSAVLAALLLWPAISSRFAQQFQSGPQLIVLPHTMDVRIQYWMQFFIPSLKTDHRFLFGTGTVIPSDVPALLQNFVDNEILRMTFRAGLAGVAVLLAMQVGLFVIAWKARRLEGWARLLGAVVAGNVLALVLMEFTAEYMGFAGVSQLFWMLVGIFALARIELTALPQSEPRATTLQPRVFATAGPMREFSRARR